MFIVNKCILLTESGRLFVHSFDENNIMFEITIGLRIDDILYNVCESEECVYELTNEQGHLSKIPRLTNYINFYEYYSSKHNNTYKTIHVKTEERDGQEVEYLTTKEIQLNPEYNPQINENILF